MGGVGGEEEGDFPCTRDLQITSRSEERRSVFISSPQMSRRKAYSNTEFPLPTPEIDPGTFSFRVSTTELMRFLNVKSCFLGKIRKNDQFSVFPDSHFDSFYPTNLV